MPEKAASVTRDVIDQLHILIRSPEIIVAAWKAARLTDADISESEVSAALLDLDPLWNELFPAEQTRIVQLLVERMDVTMDSLSIRLRTEGLAGLAADLNQRQDVRSAARCPMQRLAATEASSPLRFR